MIGYPVVIDKDTVQKENHLVIEAVTQEVYKSTDKYSSAPTCVLDIGCNSGWLMEEIMKQPNYICYGIDSSQKAIETARTKGLNVLFGAAEATPYRRTMFDIVTVVSVFQQMTPAEYNSALREIWRVLKDPGWVIGVNAAPEGGWGYQALGKSPWVHQVIEPYKVGEVKFLSKDNYMFKMSIRDLGGILNAL